ncbi:MAG TPA: dihydroorotate dehydrogenase [Polyangiales bacterium]|nr:dihydroorotate dehydrogenase [Polyangiales bacterium]
MSEDTTQHVRVGALLLKNPVLAASGCFGYGLEYDDFFDVSELGGVCTKGISLEPFAGFPPERTCETPAGMLNAIGLANLGVEAFCGSKLPELERRGVTVIANLFASTQADFVALAERLNGAPGLHALELNVSSPHIPAGALEFGKDARLCGQLVAAVRAVTSLPIWVKMTPEASDLARIAKACEDAGADAISAVNTMRALAIDVQTQKLRLQNRTGGLSGPALRPIALRIVWELVDAVSIPVIGCGGIGSARDAIEFLLAGASAIQVGTAHFSDPRAGLRVAEGVREYCNQRGLRASDLVGRARG